MSETPSLKEILIFEASWADFKNKMVEKLKPEPQKPLAGEERRKWLQRRREFFKLLHSLKGSKRHEPLVPSLARAAKLALKGAIDPIAKEEHEEELRNIMQKHRGDIADLTPHEIMLLLGGIWKELLPFGKKK